MRSRDYGVDVLAESPQRHRRADVAVVDAEPGLVVEDADEKFCGAVVGCDAATVTLEDRRGARRVFPLVDAGFRVEGRLTTLRRPRATAAPAARRTASGSVRVEAHRARVARESRIYVEGRHDAMLVDRVWSHDLAVEGVVVEQLDGVDDLPAVVAAFDPGPGRRLAVLVDHLVPGSKESRIVAAVGRSPHVLVRGHPWVDVWQTVKPSAVGIPAWPAVPPGVEWKAGVVSALGWGCDVPAAWRRILAAVDSYADLEPELLAAVEELIDFVTSA